MSRNKILVIIGIVVLIIFAIIFYCLASPYFLKTSPQALQTNTSNSLLSYMLPSVCVNGSDIPVAADPYDCPRGDTVRKLKVGEEIPYIRYAPSPMADEISKGANSLSSIWMTAYPLEDGGQQLFVNVEQDRAGAVTDRNDVAITAGHGDLDENDLPDVMGWIPSAKTFYDLLTSSQDADAVQGFYTANCEPMDGWALFPKTFTPFASPNGSFDSKNFMVDLGSTLSVPLVRENNGLYSGSIQKCSDASGYTNSGLLYSSVRQFKYESGKIMDSISALHYNVGETSRKGGLVAELMYFTPAYGKTRWESWDSSDVITNKCQPGGNFNQSGMSVNACFTAIMNTDRGDCPSTGSLADRTQSFEINGKSITAYRVGCSDRSFVTPITSASPVTVPIQPRVMHVSRDIFGANQNWILNPDFADASITGWASASTISTTKNPLTDNSSLVVSNCSNGCSVSTSRTILDASVAGNGNVMTPAERSQLTWLQNVDAGVTVTSEHASPVTLTVQFTDATGKIIATQSISNSLSANTPQRIKFSIPFTFAQLSQAYTYTLTVSAPISSNNLTIDDAYLYPQDTN